jgi:hypothetical protein
MKPTPIKTVVGCLLVLNGKGITIYYRSEDEALAILREFDKTFHGITPQG